MYNKVVVSQRLYQYQIISYHVICIWLQCAGQNVGHAGQRGRDLRLPEKYLCIERDISSVCHLK